MLFTVYKFYHKEKQSIQINTGILMKWVLKCLQVKHTNVCNLFSMNKIKIDGWGMIR